MKGSPAQEVDLLKECSLESFVRDKVQLEDEAVDKLRQLDLFKHVKTFGDLLLHLAWQKGLPDAEQADAIGKATETLLSIFGREGAAQVKHLVATVIVTKVYGALEAAQPATR